MVWPALGQAGEPSELGLGMGPVVLSGLAIRCDIEVPATPHGESVDIQFLVDGRPVAEHSLAPGHHPIELDVRGLTGGGRILEATSDEASAEIGFRVISPWLSLLPPLIAIVLALITKEVLLSPVPGGLLGRPVSFQLESSDGPGANHRQLHRPIRGQP